MKMKGYAIASNYVYQTHEPLLVPFSVEMQQREDWITEES